MKKSKPEWAVLSALCFLFVYPAIKERVLYGVFAFVIFLVFDFSAILLKRFLPPKFQSILFPAAIALLVETARFFCPLAAGINAPLIILSIYLIHLSSEKFSGRVETGFLFVLFIYLTAVLQETKPVPAWSSAPVVFLVLAFGLLVMSSLFQLIRRGK